VDKFNPDEIQQAQECTRDECATIIGEQLGVDRVIATSYSKVSETLYFLSARVIDIKDGSILFSQSNKHNGDLNTLDQALSQLARQIAGTDGKAQKRVAKASYIEPKERSSSNLIWHITAISLATVAAVVSRSEATAFNDLADKNTAFEQQYKSASSTEQTTIKSSVSSNESEMDTHEQNIQIFDAITIFAVIWEGYLLLGSDDSAPAPENVAKEPSHSPQLSFYTSSNLQYSSLNLTWRW